MINRHKVVDTSAWIEWLTKTDMASQLQPDFPNPAHCVLPSIVLYEIAMWSLRAKTPQQHESIMSILDLCQFKALDREIIDTAISMNLDRRLPMADRLIYATARAHGVEVLTCDAHFEGLPDVIFHRNVKSPPTAKEVRAAYHRRGAPGVRPGAH